MASFTETIAANNQAPTEGVDIAGNLSKGLQTGMQLASVKDQLESQKMKLADQKIELLTKQATAMTNRTKSAMFAQSPAAFESIMKSNEAYANSINMPYNSEALRAAWKDPNLRLAAQKEINNVLAGGILQNPQAVVDFYGEQSPIILDYLQNATYANAQNKIKNDQATKIEAMGNASNERVAAMGINKTQATADKEVAKEYRKESRNLDDDLKKADDLMLLVTKAKDRFDEYSKDSIGGTGPLVTLGGTTSIANSKTQALKSTFSALSLDTLSKMFQGMSKLADTNAERARFESAQPSLTNDDAVNEQILNDMMDNAKRMRDKVLEARRNLNESIGPAQSSSQRPQESQAVIDFKKYLQTAKGSPEAKQKALDAFIKKNGG